MKDLRMLARIAALEAEVESCEKEALEWKQMYEDMDNQAQQYCDRAKDLEAQRDLLLHWLCAGLVGGDNE